MNKMTRACGLLMLGITAACAAEPAPPEQQPVPSAPKAVRSAPAPKRSDAAPFSPTIRAQLAARGINVYAGSEPEPEPTPEALPWIVAGHPMTAVPGTNPTTVPERYAVQLTVRDPLVVRPRLSAPFVDSTKPGRTGECSGTLVGSTAVLTAGHCVNAWFTIGKNPATGANVRAKVRAYAISVSPRRNGTNNLPFGTISVKKSFWDVSNWPGDDTPVKPWDHDYAVLRLPLPTIPVASRQILASPTGKTVEVAHYPFQVPRGFRMYSSIGNMGSARPPFVNVYGHNASTEPDSSGAGMFEAGRDSVSGINIAEVDTSKVRRPGQIAGPSPLPNFALMLTLVTNAKITDWINAPL